MDTPPNRDDDRTANSAGAPDDDEPFRVAPLESPGLSAWEAALHKKLMEEQRRGSPFQPVEMAEQPLRFSVGGVMVLTAFAAVLFACLRLMPPDRFALALGLLAFVSLMAMSFMKPQKSIIYVGWWILLVVYLVSALAAVFQR